MAEAAQKIVGEAVYIYAFDIAYELRREPLKQLVGRQVTQFKIDASKPGPKQMSFYRPQMVELKPVERMGPLGPVQVQRSLKILPVGAISITVRVPFGVERIEELVPYHDIHFGKDSLHDEVLKIAKQVCEELKEHSIRPVEELHEDEAYTVFCLQAPPFGAGQDRFVAEDWLELNRRPVAALLTQQRDIDRLSESEVLESTVPSLSYFRRDLVVADWDAALVIDEPRHFDEAIYIMELANLQLAELEAYDRMLDDVIERGYRDLLKAAIFRKHHVLKDIREIRIDLARLSDELSNITKFLGDWHMARIYQLIAQRFHLADWHRNIDDKIKTMDDMYRILQQEQMNRWMLLLEATIVLLFLLDVVMLFLR